MDWQKPCQSITHFMTMMYLKYLSVVACLVMVTFASCDNGGEPSTTDNNKDREEILIHWVDNIIRPSYASFKIKVDALVAKTSAFTASPEKIK